MSLSKPRPQRLGASHSHLAWVLLTVIVVTSAARYVMAELTLGGRLGFPLDDSWIHLRFAQNIARHGQLAFNPGDWSSGSTAPLWSALIAIPMATGVDPVIFTKVIGTALAALAACLCWSMTWEVTASRAAAWVAGTATAVSPRLVWGAVSGMEVPLYLSLVLAATLAYVKHPRRFAPVWGALIALAGTARPETFLLFVVFIAHQWFVTRGADRRELHSAVVRATLPFAAVVLIYGLINYAGDGRPFPSTLSAKADGRGLLGGLLAGSLAEVARSLSAGPLIAFNTFLRFFFDQSALLTLFVVPGALAVAGLLGQRHPRSAIIGIIVVLAPLVLGAIAPTLAVSLQEGRYVAHGIVFAFIIAAAGVAALARLVTKPAAVWVIAVVAIARLCSQDWQYATQHARMVANINDMHVNLGTWLREHTPADALIAVNDIGAIGLFSGRRVLDLEGIVTPAVVAIKRRNGLLEYLHRERPDFVVIFREWYPELAGRPDLFQEIHRVDVPRVSAAHQTMVVYRTPWTRPADD